MSEVSTEPQKTDKALPQGSREQVTNVLVSSYDIWHMVQSVTISLKLKQPCIIDMLE